MAPKNFAELAAAIPADAAKQALASIAQGLGEKEEWDRQDFEWIKMVLDGALKTVDVPLVGTEDYDERAYWASVEN